MELSGLNPELRGLHKEVMESCKDHVNYGSLLENSIETVRSPPRSGLYHKPGVIEVSGKERYFFVGDLHGDYYTLLEALNTIWHRLEEFILVFLGDYIDRGYMQPETLSMVLKLKHKYSKNVVVLRGNHEPPSWLMPHPHDYIYDLWVRFGHNSKKLHTISMELFDAIPFALVNENFLLAVHGGPPLTVLSANNWREAFEIGGRTNGISQRSLEEILWSDPMDADIEYSPSPRGAGVLYGIPVSRKALRLIGGKLIVRGHEAVDGFKLSHGGSVVTVFTSPLVYGFNCGGIVIYEYCEDVGEWCLRRLCVKPRIRGWFNPA